MNEMAGCGKCDSVWMPFALPSTPVCVFTLLRFAGTQPSVLPYSPKKPILLSRLKKQKVPPTAL